MAISTKATGWILKRVIWESIYKKMAKNIMVSGFRTIVIVEATIHGLTTLTMMECTCLAKNMVMEPSLGVTAPFMWVHSRMTTLTEKAHPAGQTAENT
jgi:hypothetical protein